MHWKLSSWSADCLKGGCQSQRIRGVVSSIQASSIQKRNSSLEQSPEQNLNTALKINNIEFCFQLLLLVAYNSFLLKCLGWQETTWYNSASQFASIGATWMIQASSNGPRLPTLWPPCSQFSLTVFRPYLPVDEGLSFGLNSYIISFLESQ